MKKTLTAVSLLMAVVLVAMSCVACGGFGKKDLVGKWTASIDFDKLPTSSMGSSEEEKEMIAEMMESLKGVSVKLTITFKDDDTTELQIDKASAELLAEKMKGVMEQTMRSMLEAQGITGDMLESAVQASLAEFDASALSEPKKGKYDFADGKLYLFEETKDEKQYLEIEGSSSEIKVTKVVGESDYVNDAMLPFVLTKAD